MTTVAGASELIETGRPRPVAVVTTVAGAGALLAAGTAGYAALLGVTLILALVLAWGWPTVSGTRTPTTTGVVLALAAVVIVLAALRDDLRWVGAAVAFGIVLSFFAQLWRRTGREGLVLSLLAAFGGLALIASGTTAVIAGNSERGQAVVAVAMAAAVASLLGDALARTQLPAPLLGAAALAAAAAVAAVVGVRFEAVGPGAAIAVGAAVGAVSWAFRRVLSMQPGMATVRGQVAAGAGSVLAVGAIVHLGAILP